MDEFEKLQDLSTVPPSTLHRHLSDRVKRILDDMILKGYRKHDILQALNEVCIEETNRCLRVTRAGKSQ